MTQGEIWRGSFRAGVETVYGTPVAPTRRLYLGPDSGLVPGGATNRISVQTGTRAQVVAAVPGVSAPAGNFSQPVEAAEILEMLRIGHSDSPTITTPGGGTTTRLHVSVAPDDLSSATIQWHDGFRAWQAAGAYANTLRVAGAADGDNMLTGDFFASAFIQTALSGSVTDRNPVPYSGWETKLYLDVTGAGDTYGTSLIAAGESVVNWDVSLAANNLGRLYTAANTRAMNAATQGIYEGTGSLTFVAKGARALTTYNDFTAGTQRRLRLRFGDNTILEGALTSFVDVDMQIVWTEFTILGESAGVRTYEANFGYVYDSVNALASRVRAQTNRTVAF